MTTAGHVRFAAAKSEVRIAGVPWPRYKVVALAVGALVLLIVGLTTASAAPSVLAAAGSATVVWLGLGRLHQVHH